MVILISSSSRDRHARLTHWIDRHGRTPVQDNQQPVGAHVPTNNLRDRPLTKKTNPKPHRVSHGPSKFDSIH